MTLSLTLWVDGSNLTTLKNKRVEIKNQPKGLVLFSLELIIGGEGGIRTRGGLLTLTRFPGVRLKPLIHLSFFLIVSVRSTGKLHALSHCG